MSFRDEIERGVLSLDASKEDQIARNANTFIGVGDPPVPWPCVAALSSAGADKLVISYPTKEQTGIPLTGVPEGQEFPDLKAVMASGESVEVVLIHKDVPSEGAEQKEIDRVHLVLQIDKLWDSCGKGQLWSRNIVFAVLGYREDLDFEPPVVTMPKNPFPHATDHWGSEGGQK